VARRRSLLAWYVASPLFVVALLRLAFFLVRQMDKPFDPPVLVNRHGGDLSDAQLAPLATALDASPAGLQRRMSVDVAQRSASGALRDLAHEAASAGAVAVAKRAYDAEAAVLRNDTRAARAAMDDVEAAAAAEGRKDAFASSLELAKNRMRDWYAAAEAPVTP
jgi:hypothetical protein